MAHHRHKRETYARPLRARVPRAYLVAGPIAVMATLATVAAGVLAASPETRDMLVAGSTSSLGEEANAETAAELDRPTIVSRSGDRIERLSRVDMMLTRQATTKAVRNADTKLWTTAPLDLWATPRDDAAKKGLIEEDNKVLVTGREAAGRVEIVIDGDARWVTSGYLTDENPKKLEASDEGSSAGGTEATCSNGTAVPSGVSPNIAAVHQAVCANFPEITTYGTLRGDGEHAQGIAVDIMVSGARGQEVADFVRANYSDLGVNYVIHAQQIWSVDRSAEGWRFMEDRGSVTANHYDHVHVTTY